MYQRLFRPMAVLFLLLALLAVGCSSPNDTTLPIDQLADGTPPAEGASDFYTAGSTDSSSRNDDNAYEDGPTAGGDSDYASSDAATGESNKGDQESDDPAREIVESDIYKVEGDVLYVLNRYRGLVAIDISKPTDLRILGRVAFRGYPKEMFVRDGNAYVLVSDIAFSADAASDAGYYGNRTLSEIIVINIQSPANPTIVNRFQIEGSIGDTRMVGDVIYTLASQNRWYYYWDCGRGYEQRGKDQTVIQSINIADPANVYKVEDLFFDGLGHSIYVTDHSLYLAEYHDWYNWETGEYLSTGYPVHYIDISDAAGHIVKRGSFKTKGFMDDRWKMYERDGYFFAISYSWSGSQETTLQSFSVANPDAIVKLSDFLVMEGQTLQATRYEGNRLYAVTYFQRDPLHVVDISNPADMRELGQLQIPGWSTHIEIRGERLLAIGVDDTNGWKTKVAMYDVSDPTATLSEMSQVIVGEGYSYSEANQDWKAFKIFDQLGMILLPTTEYSASWGSVAYRLNIIDFDLNKGLTKRGSVESLGPIRRGIVIGDLIASIGDLEVLLVDPTDRDHPVVTDSVQVARYIANIEPCGAFLCDSGLSYWDSALHLTAFRPGDLSAEPWMSPILESNYSYYSSFLSKGEDSFLVSFGHQSYDMDRGYWQYENRAFMHRFDVAAGEAPRYVGKSELVMPQDDDEFLKDYSYYGWGNHQALLTDNGVMAVVKNRNTWGCNTPEGFLYYESCYNKGYDYGDYSYYNLSFNTLYLYDLNGDVAASYQPSAFKFTAKGVPNSYWYYYSNRPAAVVNGSSVWMTDCEHNAYDNAGRQWMRCYAQQIDISNPSKPKLAARVNIPGELVGMSKDGETFFSYQYQWAKDKDGYSYQKHYLVFLAYDKDHERAKVIKTVEISQSYGYYYDYVYAEGDTASSVKDSSENTYSYKSSTYHIADASVFVVSTTTTYSYGDNYCWWWDEMKYSLSVDLYAADDAAKIGSYATDNAWRTLKVAGGGVLVFKAKYYNVYGYPEYRDSDEMAYMDEEGGIHDLKIEDYQSEVDSSYYSWDRQVQSASRIGDTLYLARGWAGLTALPIEGDAK